MVATGFLSFALYADVHAAESAGPGDTTTSWYDDNNDNDNEDAIAWTTHHAQLPCVIDVARARTSSSSLSLSFSLSRPTPVSRLSRNFSFISAEPVALVCVDVGGRLSCVVVKTRNWHTHWVGWATSSSPRRRRLTNHSSALSDSGQSQY